MEFSSGSVGGLDSNVILISKYLTLSSGSQVTLNRPADDMNPLKGNSGVALVE
ncbi:hypothetical protein JCM19241_5607 [Vibrio ishigakensis]|uniref:Uncharacterized protein n=3 Tax=Vibrio ishigakensis TaxID=1481914 RepID=A0A0B8Q775_9VIBR|nr:hypothetical protein JCM19241_5607 [Vibrio ishigakensis]